MSLLSAAILRLGLVQGLVGAGENKLQYATNLAQSQITNDSAAEAGIRDADVAAAAANLTKAQVLQQTSLAALAQANAAPQGVLSLLKNLS
ncbi:MAG TPA: flagellin [Bryobacteraceae bacterium]|nr:flagellin [Bryobacteraceae bacterium]